jgi:hypothetical protein
MCRPSRLDQDQSGPQLILIWIGTRTCSTIQARTTTLVLDTTNNINTWQEIRILQKTSTHEGNTCEWSGPVNGISGSCCWGWNLNLAVAIGFRKMHVVPLKLTHQFWVTCNASSRQVAWSTCKNSSPLKISFAWSHSQAVAWCQDWAHIQDHIEFCRVFNSE